MYFDSFSALINMDGHGLYVWLSYAAFLLVIRGNLWRLSAARKEALKLAKLSIARDKSKHQMPQDAKTSDVQPTNKQQPIDENNS